MLFVLILALVSVNIGSFDITGKMFSGVTFDGRKALRPYSRTLLV
jgi:hypothetical protein